MVKQGYKQTEIGVIPEEWSFSASKCLMKIETGSRNTEHKIDEGKYPFFVRSQKVEHIDTYHYDCEAVLTAGDGVGTGKIFHHYVGKFDAHQRVYVMSNFNGVFGRFFYNYFSENFGKEVAKYTAKSSVDSVRRDMIAEMIIPLPPFAEQERIAEALSDVDSMIFSLEKLIAKKKAVKQGAMQELLTGKKRLPGFTGEWKCHRLGEYVDCIRGVSYNGSNDVFVSESNQTIRLLRSNNIQGAKFDSNDVQYISRDIVRDYQMLKKFDIMICMANGSRQLVGKNCIFTETLNERYYTFGAFMSCLRATVLHPHQCTNENASMDTNE